MKASKTLVFAGLTLGGIAVVAITAHVSLLGLFSAMAAGLQVYFFAGEYVG